MTYKKLWQELEIKVTEYCIDKKGNELPNDKIPFDAIGKMVLAELEEYSDDESIEKTQLEIAVSSLEEIANGEFEWFSVKRFAKRKLALLQSIPSGEQGEQISKKELQEIFDCYPKQREISEAMICLNTMREKIAYLLHKSKKKREQGEQIVYVPIEIKEGCELPEIEKTVVVIYNGEPTLAYRYKWNRWCMETAGGNDEYIETPSFWLKPVKFSSLASYKAGEDLEQEIERLKELIEDAYWDGRNFEMQNNESITWDIFKSKNNL